MNYKAYRQSFFVHPPPEPRYDHTGLFGASLFYQEYEEAVAYYTRVLGEPAYVEGDNTRGWPIGGSWLTLFPAAEGSPMNAEITIMVSSPAEADRLHQAFIDAGGSGEPPFDDLMYEPLRIGAVRDPFGADFLIVARLDEEQ